MAEKNTKKTTIEISIQTPEYDTSFLFLQHDQVKHTYLLLCNRYVKYLKSGNFIEAETIKKLLTDYVIMGESQEFDWFKGFIQIK